VSGIREARNTCKALVLMPGGKRFFGRSSCKWKDRKKKL
jgi:hypothetical protein